MTGTTGRDKPSNTQASPGYLSSCLPVTPGPPDRNPHAVTDDKTSDIERLGAHISDLQLAETLDRQHVFVRKLLYFPTLVPEILWHIFNMMKYRECWKLAFVCKRLRERVLEHLEWVMQQKMRTGQWRIALDTKGYERDYDIYFSVFPSFDRRSLNLCVALECTDMITDMWLPKPTTYEVKIRLVLCISPITYRIPVQIGTHMERYLGEGIAVSFFEGLFGELNSSKWSKLTYGWDLGKWQPLSTTNGAGAHVVHVYLTEVGSRLWSYGS